MNAIGNMNIITLVTEILTKNQQQTQKRDTSNNYDNITNYDNNFN